MSSFHGFDQEPDNIDELLEKMEEFEYFLRGNNKESFIPFLRAYKRITRKVKNRKNVFDNPSELEKLDLKFGQLYFEAMKAYFEKGEKKRPWKTYLTYVERDDSRPLLELALGINAHINADLAVLINEMEYEEKDDFQKVNKILLEALFPVIFDIAYTRRDLESFTFLGAGPLPFFGLKKITKWRENAWKSGSKDKEQILQETERKASDMIKIRHDKTIRGLFEKPYKILEA